jgi:transcriptional regulator with XRE-family HTH domain
MVSQAVISLRRRRGETQTEFGRKLGVSLPTIQRWESVASPSGACLLHVMRLADISASADLGDVFCAQLSRDFGLSVESLREVTEELTLP